MKVCDVKYAGASKFAGKGNSGKKIWGYLKREHLDPRMYIEYQHYSFWGWENGRIYFQRMDSKKWRSFTKKLMVKRKEYPHELPTEFKEKVQSEFSQKLLFESLKNV